MMFDLQLFAEKTEEATPHRRQEVRRKGQVAKSSDLSAAFVLLAGALYLYWGRYTFFSAYNGLLRDCLLTPSAELDAGSFFVLAQDVLGRTALLLLPLLAICLAVALAANLAQTGFVFSTHPIQPKLEHLNPLQGASRLFSRRALMQLAKGLAKVAFVSLAVWILVRGRLTELMLAIDMGVGEMMELLAGLLFQVALVALAVFVAVALADYIFQRKDFERNIRMSKQEQLEERKQMEGDPLVRAHLRQMQRDLARHRMMHAVPEASVVVTNPTQVAVALRYRGDEGAPRVVAKGVGQIAARIRELAEAHGVPVVSDPPTARALYRQVKIGAEIPLALYQAVAEILAHIYQRQGLS
jgi:flagellar biosynthetic protein FlhB